jgi:hypothetical protein
MDRRGIVLDAIDRIGHAFAVVEGQGELLDVAEQLRAECHDEFLARVRLHQPDGEYLEVDERGDSHEHGCGGHEEPRGGGCDRFRQQSRQETRNRLGPENVVDDDLERQGSQELEGNRKQLQKEKRTDEP